MDRFVRMEQPRSRLVESSPISNARPRRHYTFLARRRRRPPISLAPYLRGYPFSAARTLCGRRRSGAFHMESRGYGLQERAVDARTRWHGLHEQHGTLSSNSSRPLYRVRFRTTSVPRPGSLRKHRSPLRRLALSCIPLTPLPPEVADGFSAGSNPRPSSATSTRSLLS